MRSFLLTNLERRKDAAHWSFRIPVCSLQTQLPALGAWVAARRAVFERYRDGLGALPGLGFMPEPGWSRANRWLSVALFQRPAGAPDREAVRRALAAAGIESRPVWKPLHLQPVFRAAPRAGGAVAAGLFAEGLCLPSGSGLGPAQQDRVMAVVRRLAGAAAGG